MPLQGDVVEKRSAARVMAIVPGANFFSVVKNRLTQTSGLALQDLSEKSTDDRGSASRLRDFAGRRELTIHNPPENGDGLRLLIKKVLEKAGLI